MVYVFHSSLKHKRLISLPCGGQEREKERGKTSLRKNGLYFPALFTFSSELKFMRCLRLFGTLGPAGLARVAWQTLYDTAAPLLIRKVDLQNLMEKFRVAVRFKAQPSTVSGLFFRLNVKRIF